jgi:hypothetical protein
MEGLEIEIPKRMLRREIIGKADKYESAVLSGFPRYDLSYKITAPDQDQNA